MHAYDRQLVDLFSCELFGSEHVTSVRDDDSPYRRMRHLNQRLDRPSPLLVHDRDYLRDLLELTAIVDPRLFHVMFLNHCLATGGALDYAEDSMVPSDSLVGFEFGTALMTEVGHGNSGANILTEAVYDPERDDFVLTTPVPEAVKFPPNVGRDGWSKWGLVGARLKVADRDRGLFLFVVALRDESGPRVGVRIRSLPDTTLLSLDYAAVTFDGVRVPRRCWLSDGARLAADGSFADPLGGAERTSRSAAVVRFAWGALCPGLAAMARASAALALVHARRRVITNRFATNVPAIAYRNQRLLLATALASAFAATALARGADAIGWRLKTDRIGSAAPRPHQLRTLSLLKVAVNRLAEQAITAARATCGALGFMSVNRLVDYLGFALAFASAGGDNQMILLEGAWSMVTDQDYRPPGQPEPDTRGVPIDERVANLVGPRETRLHARLRDRLRRAADEGADPFRAWNDQAEHAQEFAEAHLDRLASDALGEATDDGVDDATRVALADLRLYLNLRAVGRHSGWYQAQGLLTATEVEAIPERAQVCGDRICAALDTLLPALGVPLHLTRAPIAGPDYVNALVPQHNHTVSAERGEARVG
jgi:acyl-CoA oxidase